MSCNENSISQLEYYFRMQNVMPRTTPEWSIGGLAAPESQGRDLPPGLPVRRRGVLVSLAHLDPAAIGWWVRWRRGGRSALGPPSQWLSEGPPPSFL